MSRRIAYLWIGVGVVAGAVGVLAAALLIAGALAPPTAAGPPRFVAEPGGVEHVYDGDFPYFVGGGVAVLDCDGDLRPDLYLAGGENPASLYRNESVTGGPLAFQPVADDASRLAGVTGAYPLDVDSDGVTDLAVLRHGENVMLRGRGDCRFERANELWGVDGGDEWTVAFSAMWEPGWSLPTFVFGNYVDLSDTGARTGCSDNVLFRPAGERYGDATTLAPGWCTLSALFSDWDRSGRRDLRLTNDRHYYRDGEEQLWRVAAGEAPRLYGREDGWNQMQIWGMGIASQDLTGDGLPEVYLTSQADNKLQTLADGPARPDYVDVALDMGVTAHRPYAGDVTKPSTAWHAEFQDVNNDGFIDLFVSKGNVEAQLDYATRDPNNLLLGQPDGTFTESASLAGLVDFTSTRGAAVVDLDLDGMLDLVEVNRRRPVAIWRNVGLGQAPPGHWVGLRLVQPGPNRDAVGAWIEVKVGERVTTREVTVGGGHAGGQSGWIHFGLGESDRARLRVQWPDGEWSAWMDVSADGFLTVDRAADQVSYWNPDDD